MDTWLKDAYMHNVYVGAYVGAYWDVSLPMSVSAVCYYADTRNPLKHLWECQEEMLPGIFNPLNDLPNQIYIYILPVIMDGYNA